MNYFECGLEKCNAGKVCLLPVLILLLLSFINPFLIFFAVYLFILLFIFNARFVRVMNFNSPEICYPSVGLFFEQLSKYPMSLTRANVGIFVLVIGIMAPTIRYMHDAGVVNQQMLFYFANFVIFAPIFYWLYIQLSYKFLCPKIYQRALNKKNSKSSLFTWWHLLLIPYILMSLIFTFGV